MNAPLPPMIVSSQTGAPAVAGVADSPPWPGLGEWSIDALHAMTLDFETVDFAGATRRRVAIGRLEQAPCAVVSAAAGEAAWDWLQGRLAEGARVAWVRDADFDALLGRYGAEMRAMDGVDAAAPAAPGEAPAEEIGLAALSVEANPAVRLLGSTLFDAFRSAASDIHVESTPRGARIQYRLDGVLAPGGTIDGRELAEQVVSRIKVLGQLDVGERRLPQDGRFRVRIEGRDVDFRVSIMPSSHGEDAVLRILDRRALADERSTLDLARLGFGDDELVALRELARRPHGMMLVTGPTGSGKTTTLYAALSEVNTGRQKIITIEDPVEYQLAGVLQVPVNERTGLTFVRGLRAILRHDPDTLLVGEIRDRETAQIAVQAALTGHLVMSSIHANTVFDVLARFHHMGVDPYELTSALNGVVAQRLLRQVCGRCAEPVVPRDALRERFAALRGEVVGRRGRGCGDCRGTGFRGRIAVAEILRVDDDLREGILSRESPRTLRSRALAAGMTPLAERAAVLAAAGRTSFEELERVAEMA
jgi:general secretion pathway protein E